MSTQFSEVIIKAPFLMVKGFLMGYMQGAKKDFEYFFHRKHSIKRESMGELMRELFHVECHTHICLPTDIFPDFQQALHNVEHKLCAQVESAKQIKSASFTFSFHNYNEAETGIYKELFRNIPRNVELINYNPLELRGDALVGVSEYTHINQYVYEGYGTVSGDFQGVMDFYLKVKRHRLVDSILCGEVKLVV
ncbi:hypothetical protein EH223_08925 [candidate division KSB1 bacterium]|nr:hypothetical protein [candidate division KSB1 bacterium]RQW03844.1 MAG: hypothetical protein EH223_08925 [candidate division KSB1 bacterium]